MACPSATLFIGPMLTLTNDSLTAGVKQLENRNLTLAKRRPGRPKKDKKMATTQTTPTTDGLSEQNAGEAAAKGATKTIAMSVFDLASFDDVKLEKDVPVPSKPTTLEEALQACGNDSAKLLDVIHEGLISEALESARGDMSGWTMDDENGKPVPYTGNYADEKKTKAINAAVLNLAKINGYDKNIGADAKRAIKDRMKQFLRDNPVILGSIQG